ncbi:hypothetical protein GOQ30_12545 [Flavobacterium sp. TP390]|uniref:Uncharacterized protein n=1 Tax=Flavobacterium profundi TaxID=1774945 RepID=A0A6I4IT01_9FLAO|nr:hypothetical protein [Flavobacterium profundi]MVO09992.1 hypothetical protein [Flavobacterium profundi]
MKNFEDLLFLDEIVLQVKIARKAVELLETTKTTFDKIEVWGSIQSILVTAGNVSKILWPSDNKYKSRGERLRELLKIDKDNILSNRKFRNHFEHYDSRIEEWFNNQPSAVYIDLAMNPSFSGLDLNTHRGYNSFNNTLQFREEILDLNHLLEEMEKILESCKPYTLI